MDVVAALTLFVLAVFLGIELISKVPPTLHTPLMSGSNAISGITVLGAVLAAGADSSTLASILGFLAVTLATVNVVGGFLVTHRMLGMFRTGRRPARSAAASAGEPGTEVRHERGVDPARLPGGRRLLHPWPAGLSRPRTAVRGNLLGSIGMLVAVAVTLTDQDIVSFPLILAGVVVGAAIGGALATRVPITAMPELVALFNGFGGSASVLVAMANVDQGVADGGLDAQEAVAAAAAVVIGSVTFSGSVIAFAKLAERLHVDGYPRIRIVNVGLALVALLVAVVAAADGGTSIWFWLALVLALALGVSGTLPVGGADMPVVIALLNSLSGLAAAAAGFVLDNPLLIIAGSLVGASGLILTQVMCRAMTAPCGRCCWASPVEAPARMPTRSTEARSAPPRPTTWPSCWRRRNGW